MHGDVLDRKAPQLHVVSSIGVNPSLAWLLSTRIGMAGGAPPEPKGGLPDTQARGEMVSFRVNDDSVTFELLQGPGGWVARADRDDHQITIEGIRFSLEDVELQTVTDLEPYIQGRRRLLERLRAAG